MKNRLVFLGLLVFALQAAARQVTCDDAGTRLNRLASVDQQIRQKWNLLEQNPKATTAHHAWLLAQHADSDLAFQRLAKGLLEASVKAGIAAPRDLAYLADRIAANEGRPQEYGTQFSQSNRCHLVLDPVDNRELVNRRRSAIGLQSLEEYEAEGRRRFIPPDCPGTTSQQKN